MSNHLGVSGRLSDAESFGSPDESVPEVVVPKPGSPVGMLPKFFSPLDIAADSILPAAFRISPLYFSASFFFSSSESFKSSNFLPFASIRSVISLNFSSEAPDSAASAISFIKAICFFIKLSADEPHPVATTISRQPAAQLRKLRIGFSTLDQGNCTPDYPRCDGTFKSLGVKRSAPEANELERQIAEWQQVWRSQKSVDLFFDESTLPESKAQYVDRKLKEVPHEHAFDGPAAGV